MIPTIIDTLTRINNENIFHKYVIHKGYGSRLCRSRGPPTRAICGRYLVGETIKLLNELSIYEYDIVLFNILGNIVGRFFALLNYANYYIIVIDNGFDELFIVNCIVVPIRDKSKSTLNSEIGKKHIKRYLIDKYVGASLMPIIELLPPIEVI
eukprot:Gb_31885 [translate_table: standard]